MASGWAVSRGVYRYLCPNCGGPNTEERLSQGLPCPRCLPSIPGRRVSSWSGLARLLKREGTLGAGVKAIASLEDEARSLWRFFEKAVGSPPWGAQRTWAKRLARGDSFSIIAPTGVGKTTFGAAAALFYACRKGMRSYIILPTTTLAANVAKKLESMVESTGCRKARILVIHSKLKAAERREALERFENGDFDILVTTAAFARKYVDKLSGYRFRLVFVDDVDAVLRSARSVDAILRIVGFDEEAIETGLEVLRLQREQARLVSLLQSPREEVREEARKKLLEVKRRLESLEAEIEAKRKGTASLIVSSATGRPRGARVRLFRVLLNFEAGGRGDIGLRRVVDSYTYPQDGVTERVVELVKTLGTGGLVYVPIDMGVEYAEKLAEDLRRAGVKAEAYHAKKPLELLDRFAEGEIDVLVGVANYYGTLVRGIDLPARVRYAVFAGVPRHKFGSDIGDPHPSRLLRLLSILAESRIEEVASAARSHMGRLRRILRLLSPAALQMIAERVARGEVEGGYDKQVLDAYNFLREALRRDDVWESLRELDVGVVREGGRTYILVPDPATYLQASGRTSRLYAGGITLGLSVVVVDNEAVLRGLMKRVSWMAEVEWRRLEDLDLHAVIREIDEDREKVRKVVKGLYKGVELVRTALLVVESPNKARTIARFFGQPSVRLLPGGGRVYEVATGDRILMIMASGGHVFDLVVRVDGRDVEVAGGEPENAIFGVLRYRTGGNGATAYTPVYTSIKRCLECGYQFVEESSRCPRCGSELVRNSLSTIEDLRRVAWEADEVYIGTDPDTEGEKIGWDVALALRPYAPNIRRLEFHEVTKKAILEALSSPRSFDKNLVDAQVVRRVEDRWIGFTLSPLLWCDFWPRYCRRVLEEYGEKRPHMDRERCARYKAYYNLSAGRVQTPTLGWVVDRTLAYRRKVWLYRVVHDSQVLFAVRSDDPEVPESVKSVLDNWIKHHRKTGIEPWLDVKVVVEKEEWTTIAPPPPYTTDTMLRDANRLLGLGSAEAMRLAQDLFEWGLITYHRTDSTRVSDRGMQVAREWLETRFGGLASKLYRPRRWGEGGAHEAIRPVRPIDVERLQLLVEEGVIELPGSLTRRHLRLYDMIFRRFMASQMREADALRVVYRLHVPELDGYILTLERVVEVGRPGDAEGVTRGFTLVWPYVRPQPRLIEGREAWIRAVVEGRQVPRAYPYTEGEIVEEMKTRGIGRPSTYAKIVETLFRRRYVIEISREEGRGAGFVVATSRGISVHNYLTKELAEAVEEEYGARIAEILRRVPSLVSETRTRELEREMDMVERGEASRDDVLDRVFNEISDLALLLNIEHPTKHRSPARGNTQGNTWVSRFVTCAVKTPEAARVWGAEVG
ncbi:reverse gyrase [Aeropyrum camini]|uniref:Reverse gyrase n=1 Tax=Aeropyrum camini SY1 = JCM 12091 TaxID=1198449 RepID=U3T9V5_9CREN|nr:reverse gyrase [Aeropyrum camini]BAN90317.1 reverse gyrase [Aeropyrum camini SY1 = JCM 12091]